MNNGTDGWCGLASVVQERVLVVWHDKDDVERCFGCLHEGEHDGEPEGEPEREHEEEHEDADCEGNHRSEYAKCNGSLSLEIFQSEGVDRTVMVNFHLPVKIGKTKYPRHMYIVIPTSALSMTRHVESTVPENIRKHLPQASSYNRIHLELSNSEEPYAVMPKVQRQPRQIGKRLTGIARQLIICLKSLCQAKSWDAFLVGNGTMQNQIDATCRLLDEGNVSEPPIDLGSIYNDGVYGCINSWHDYPYQESNCADPPPYHATAPRHPRSPNAASSKRSPSEDELYWKSSPDRYRPASSCEDDTVEAATSTKRKKGVDEEPDDDDGAATAHKHFRKATSSSNLKLSLTDSVAAWHQRLDARINAAPAPSPTQADTDSSAPFHDNVPPTEDPGVLADKAKVAIDNNSPSPDPTLPSTLQSAAATDVPNPQPDCHAGPAELYFKMAEFLLYCLRIDPCAPTRYKKELRQMARFVYQQEDAVFHSIKRDCLYDLSNHSARRELPMQPDPAPLPKQIKELYIWLDTEVSKEAYLYIGRHFVRLEELTLQEAKAASGDLRSEFEIRKADLYAAAFYAADILEEGCAIPPPVLCEDCLARLTRSYPSFR